MNALEMILLPFALIYRGFITILCLPYYIVLLFVKLFDLIFNPNKTSKKTKTKGEKIIAEAKNKNEKIVVREKRTVYDNSNQSNTNQNEEKDNAKKQELFEKYVKKARDEEKKRIEYIEKTKLRNAEREKQRIAKELAKDELEQKKLVEAQKKLEQAKKEGKVPFEIKFKQWLKKANTPMNQDVILDARKEVLKEGFKEEVKKGEDLQPMLFTYVAKDKDGNLETSEIEALTRMDVHSFLVNEGYEVYDIYLSKSNNYSMVGNKKMNKSNLVFYLSQLSAYLKSGIALSDCVKILSKQAKKKSEKATWRSIYYDLSMGDVLSVSMEKRKDAFPKLLINMIKTAEMTGNLAETLDDMVEYYSEAEQTRKQMKSAMTYPTIIMTFAFLVIIFIFVFVVPKFEEIFKSFGAKMPAITKFIMNLSEFLQKYGIFIVVIIAALIIFVYYLYKTDRTFRKSLQEFAMHLPVFGKVIIYNEITIFSKTFANLINHNVFITDSIGVLNKITNNEVYKKLIFDTATNLNKGDPISKAFENHWAFPDIAFQMLITGEKTGRLGQMMERVSNYFNEQHRNIINQMKSLIEPMLIVFLAVVVGVILMSVMIPMFNMYSAVS